MTSVEPSRMQRVTPTGPELCLEAVGVELLDIRVLENVDLAIRAGSWLSLIGPNGAGKTTLLRAVSGAVPHDGRITFGGEAIDRLRERRRARTVAVVPQRPERPDGMRVLDYVLLGRSPYIPYLGTEGDDDLAVAHAQIDRLDLRRVTGRSVTALSGGEFQRVVLARALAQQAPLLLLDEPTSSLDLGHAQDVLELVDELRRERGLTVVSAMHDLTTAAQFSDELALLVDGRAVARGAPAAVLTPEAVATHYGASVHVVHDPVVGPVLVPRRRRRPETGAGGVP